MKVNTGHLTYCTNIHPGKNWNDDFTALKDNFSFIKESVSPGQPLGIGLRLSNVSSLELSEQGNIAEFKHWLKENNAYVFTMNGFPYGEFHRTVVKEDVHTPDWTTEARKDYTIRLFTILQSLLPEGMVGGISTSPLSYRHWFKTATDFTEAKNAATINIVAVIQELVTIANATGTVMHLDLEPEPDGIIETGREFIDWYTDDLLPTAISDLVDSFGITAIEAEALTKRHLCLCYDVCHFAIGYEDHADVLKELKEKGIAVGKIQISAALKANMDQSPDQRIAIKESFQKFNEPTYLHQVVALKRDGKLIRYTDLTPAIADFEHQDVMQWRAHFHVPISVQDIGVLQSTQQDIIEVLNLQKVAPFTEHLEVETYTWEVLPEQLKIPIAASISNELEWVIKTNV
ncbi:MULTISPECIES: metabolite traffic protein EboE [Sphingobacterium]|uniref:Metabolite traffic protein EboE n=1 Tax=Sphingobacterium kitahiroshimense TaxID=470446 RepID=A0ABV0BTY1_9SPHI|nr:metabolite traffic protein EboE [Sphingobacterium sp. UDSM-2020]QQD11577.1 metabolite traffic protein EboE [Sphingobacterium sp. UDSM-2020]